MMIGRPAGWTMRDEYNGAKRCLRHMRWEHRNWDRASDHGRDAQTLDLLVLAILVSLGISTEDEEPHRIRWAREMALDTRGETRC